MEKELIYTRIFYEISDHELKALYWLKKNGGDEGERWRHYFEDKYFIIVGQEQSDVGTCGDLYIEIYDWSLAFQFEIFKVGGEQRDYLSSTREELDSVYEYVDEHSKYDKPVFREKY
jgi:hypothetical protein